MGLINNILTANLNVKNHVIWSLNSSDFGINEGAGIPGLIP